jgi:hypothetical protein
MAANLSKPRQDSPGRTVFIDRIPTLDNRLSD